MEERRPVPLLGWRGRAGGGEEVESENDEEDGGGAAVEGHHPLVADEDLSKAVVETESLRLSQSVASDFGGGGRSRCLSTTRGTRIVGRGGAHHRIFMDRSGVAQVHFYFFVGC